MTEQEKDELFGEFVVRMAEIDQQDKRLSVARNNHVLRGMTAYYKDCFAYGNPKRKVEIWEYDKDGIQHYKFFGLYQTYLKLRACVPFLVQMKKLKGKCRDHYTSKYSSSTIILEDSDYEEATKVGKMLLDFMVKYIEED
jgi:hypothetical protein